MVQFHLDPDSPLCNLGFVLRERGSFYIFTTQPSAATLLNTHPNLHPRHACPTNLLHPPPSPMYPECILARAGRLLLNCESEIYMFISPRSRAARSRLSQGSACQAERFRATFKEKTFGAIFPTLFPPFGANMPICILQLFPAWL